MTKVSHDSETPAHGKQVITACAFIHDTVDGEVKVFRPKRAATKKFLPDLFELPGGHIDYGENIVEGLKREVLEETGMRISVGDSFYAFDYLNEIKGSHSLEVVFFAKFLDLIENIQLEAEDHSEWKWMSEDEVRSFPTTESEQAAVLRGFALIKTGKINLG